MKKHMDEKRLESNVKKQLKNTCIDETLLDVLIEMSMLYSTNLDTRTDWIVNCFQSNGARLATVKLWLNLIRDYPTADQVKKARCAEIKKKNDKLLHNIIYAKGSSSNKDQCNKLLHDIACYIAIDAGLGDITNAEVLNHIIAALKSVLPSKQVIRFTCKKQSEKLKQLTDLSNIVTGVKLYNEDCNIVGEVSIKLEKVIAKAKNFLDCLSQSSLVKINDAIKYVIRNFNKMEENSKIHDAKCYIIFQHVAQKCVMSISNDVNCLSDQLHMLVAQLRQKIICVRRSVKFRPAVPIVEIYPEFEGISKMWRELQHMIIRTNVTCHLISKLSSIYNTVNVKVDILDDNIEEESNEDNVKIYNDYCEVIYEFMDNDNLQYGGYCLYSLVRYEGLLRKSNTQIGVVKYDHLYYSFSSKKALSQFSYNPKFFVDNGLKELRKRPEVIKALNMENYSTVLKTGIKCSRKCNETMDKGIQTELHPLENSENYEYTNNAWHILKQQSVTIL